MLIKTAPDGLPRDTVCWNAQLKRSASFPPGYVSGMPINLVEVNTLVYNSIIALELSCVLFYLMWTLSMHKYKLITCLELHGIITLLLIVVVTSSIDGAAGYGNETAQRMLWGCLCFIPILISYGGNWRLRLTMAFYTFSYGVAIFSLAIRAAHLFPSVPLSVTTLVLQTLLYAGSLRGFVNFSKEKFAAYIENADAKRQHLLFQQTLGGFLMIAAYDILIEHSGAVPEKLLVLILLVYFIVQTNLLLADYLQAEENNQDLTMLTTTDRLTGLGNILALQKKLHSMQKEGGRIFLLFMDLDAFKSVNDTYGHQAGDDYLIRFANVLRELDGVRADFFRKSGDEFIALTRDEGLCRRLRSIHPKMNDGIEFLGVSVGCARMPADGETLDELLSAADLDMYRQKRNKNVIR